jgi:hypothetical protein
MRDEREKRSRALAERELLRYLREARIGLASARSDAVS